MGVSDRVVVVHVVVVLGPVTDGLWLHGAR